jgi:hypothetical protein
VKIGGSWIWTRQSLSQSTCCLPNRARQYGYDLYPPQVARAFVEQQRDIPHSEQEQIVQETLRSMIYGEYGSDRFSAPNTSAVPITEPLANQGENA